MGNFIARILKTMGDKLDGIAGFALVGFAAYTYSKLGMSEWFVIGGLVHYALEIFADWAFLPIPYKNAMSDIFSKIFFAAGLPMAGIFGFQLYSEYLTNGSFTALTSNTDWMMNSALAASLMIEQFLDPMTYGLFFIMVLNSAWVGLLFQQMTATATDVTNGLTMATKTALIWVPDMTVLGMLATTGTMYLWNLRALWPAS